MEPCKLQTVSLLWCQTNDREGRLQGEETGLISPMLPVGWPACRCCGLGSSTAYCEFSLHLVSCARGGLRFSVRWIKAKESLLIAMILALESGNSVK